MHQTKIAFTVAKKLPASSVLIRVFPLKAAFRRLVVEFTKREIQKHGPSRPRPRTRTRIAPLISGYDDDDEYDELNPLFLQRGVERAAEVPT